MITINKLKEKVKRILFYFKNDFPYRRYFRRKKCIFIHIPKSAGTSILTSIANGGRIYRDHATWREYYRYDPYRFRDYFKFTFVRNPFDRLVSTYFYLLSGGNQNHDLYYKKYFEENNITFDVFIMDFLNESRIFENMMFAPQYIYVYDYKYNLKVDFIGKFETIEEDFVELSKRIKGLNELSTINPSNRNQDYKSYYKNYNLIEKVVRLYEKDFEFFNYSKNFEI